MEFRQIEALQGSALSRLRSPLPGEGRLQHGGDLPQIMRPKNKVEMRKSLQQRVPHLLGHAPTHPDDPGGSGLFPVSESPQIAVELILCFIADRAGVDHQNVRLIGRGSGFQAAVVEQIGEFIRVMDVHLTAVCPNMKGFQSLPRPRTHRCATLRQLPRKSSAITGNSKSRLGK